MQRIQQLTLSYGSEGTAYSVLSIDATLYQLSGAPFRCR